MVGIVVIGDRFIPITNRIRTGIEPVARGAAVDCSDTTPKMTSII